MAKIVALKEQWLAGALRKRVREIPGCWPSTIIEQATKINELLDESPSLVPSFAELASNRIYARLVPASRPRNRAAARAVSFRRAAMSVFAHVEAIKLLRVKIASFAVTLGIDEISLSTIVGVYSIGEDRCALGLQPRSIFGAHAHNIAPAVGVVRLRAAAPR